MPHSRPYFVKIDIQHYWPFLKYNPHFSDKAFSQVTNERWFKEPENMGSDAPNKFLQRHMKLEVGDELVNIVGENPYCTSKYPAKFLNYWN